MPFIIPILLLGGAVGGTALAVGYGAEKAEATAKWVAVAAVAISAGVIYTTFKR